MLPSGGGDNILFGGVEEILPTLDFGSLFDTDSNADYSLLCSAVESIESPGDVQPRSSYVTDHSHGPSPLGSDCAEEEVEHEPQPGLIPIVVEQLVVDDIESHGSIDAPVSQPSSRSRVKRLKRSDVTGGRREMAPRLGQCETWKPEEEAVVSPFNITWNHDQLHLNTCKYPFLTGTGSLHRVPDAGQLLSTGSVVAETVVENSINRSVRKPSSSEVLDDRKEIRKEQNRRAATKCRNKKKREEDQLRKEFEEAQNERRRLELEVKDLRCEIKRHGTILGQHLASGTCRHLPRPQHR